MANYKQLYFELYAKVADAIELLITAQQKAEVDYIDNPDAPPVKLVTKDISDV